MRIPMFDASVRRRAAFTAVALVATTVASLAAPGGGYWAAVGGGRVAARRSGVRPQSFPANLRFDFGGVEGDLTGMGTILSYDAEGQNLLDTIPFTWETRNGRTFRLDLDEAALAPWLEGVLAEAAGAECTVTLLEATGRGRLRLRGEAIGVKIRALGECSIDGGETRVVRATVRAK